MILFSDEYYLLKTKQSPLLTPSLIAKEQIRLFCNHLKFRFSVVLDHTGRPFISERKGTDTIIIRKPKRFKNSYCFKAKVLGKWMKPREGK